MNIKYIFIGIILLIVTHFILYFFNIDIFECFEKKTNKIQVCKSDENIDKITKELTQGLEQLKEINNT